LLVLPPQTSNVYLGVPARLPPGAILPKCKCLQIAGRQKGLCWKAVAQPHLPMALLAHTQRDWGCLLVLPPQTSNVAWERGCHFQAPSSSPSSKMRTSADSSQPEGAILESCCSASSAHGTAHTEAQRLGLLACLATSNFKRIFGGPCKAPSGSHSPKMQMSADSWKAEGAMLESCCSASSAHDTARTEKQSLRLIASLDNSKFRRS